MTSSDHAVEALKHLIIEAFQAVPHPGIAAIAACDCQECEGYRAWYGTHTWQDLLAELRGMENESWASCLFEPAAVHNFLPAFMSYSLERTDSDADIHWDII